MKLAAFLYGLAVRFRLRLYQKGFLPTRRLPFRVISIGNLIAGGTGKTPHTALLAGYLQKKGMKTAILSRGFRGTGMRHGAVVSDGQAIRSTVQESGEEPLWLAQKLEGLPVVIGRNRYRSGMEFLRNGPTEWVVLDDGFQHLALARDINILLLPGQRPLASERLLPSGMLREPLEAMKRADIILITHAEHLDNTAREAWISEIRSRSSVPVYFSEHRPSMLWQYPDKKNLPLTWLKDKRVLAFCGLADPDSFWFSLRQLGADLIKRVAFTDHHHYGEKDLRGLETLSRTIKPDLLVTTEKDAIKFNKWPVTDFPLVVLAIEVEIQESGFWNWLDREVGLV
jgi:tetraacyldisaccharide 4'-kinase